MKMFITAVGVLFFGFLYLSPTAQALSCIPPDQQNTVSLTDRIDQYQVIFTGTVGDFVRQSNPALARDQKAFSVYNVQVDQSFKGLPAETTELELKTYATAWYLWATAEGRSPEYNKGDSFLFLAEKPMQNELVEINMNPDCSQEYIIYNLSEKSGTAALKTVQALKFETKSNDTNKKDPISWWSSFLNFWMDLLFR